MTRWLMLRTSGPQTLPLARSLAEAGFEVWTPVKTLRRRLFAKPFTRAAAKGVRVIDTDIAILPTFVFARERQIAELAIVANQPVSPHPAFSIFRHAGRVPLIGEAEVAGLREEEARAAATILAMREADSREEAERIRIAAIKSEAARRRAERELEHGRRRALRAEPPSVGPGAVVGVREAPAFVGVTGIVEQVDGPYAHVRFGSQSWKIEGWRLMPAALDEDHALRGLAA